MADEVDGSALVGAEGLFLDQLLDPVLAAAVHAGGHGFLDPIGVA